MKRMFTAATLVGALVPSAFGADYGKVTGQVIINGTAPKVGLKVKKGDPAVKDATVCAAVDVSNDELVVNPKNNGIANCFVYLKKVDAATVHPDHKTSKVKELVFDQKNCQFIPQAMVVRTDQIVRVKSDDAVQHNTHTYPVKNLGVNNLIAANDRTGITIGPIPQTERLPFEVKCDIHSWMRAYWLVVDHPYATVTDADGKFTLENVPTGDHDLVIWQSTAGYVEKALAVKVAKNGTTDLKQIKADAAKFKP